MSRKTPEGRFNEHLDEELDRRLPGQVSLKMDPGANFNGIPDRMVLYKDRWALLESKKATKADRQPHQEHYIDKFGKMSFTAFIYPENCDEVLDDLEKHFKD